MKMTSGRLPCLPREELKEWSEQPPSDLRLPQLRCAGDSPDGSPQQKCCLSHPEPALQTDAGLALLVARLYPSLKSSDYYSRAPGKSGILKGLSNAMQGEADDGSDLMRKTKARSQEAWEK